MELSRNPGDAPLYRQLYSQIRRQILSGEYKPGDMIPTELEYQNRYGLSRVTVRQAMLELVREHYLKRVKGRGTIVQPPLCLAQLPGVGALPSSLPADSEQSYVNLRMTSAHGEVAEYFGLEEGTTVYRLRQAFARGGYPFVYLESYLPPEMNREMQDHQYQGSYDRLREKWYDLRAAAVEQEITAAVADKEMAAILETESGMPVIRIRRKLLNAEGKLCALTYAYYSSDRYAFVMRVTE